MKFIIERTSDWENGEQPYEGAVCIGEEDGVKKWEIEVNTLEELLDIIDKTRQALIIDRDHKRNTNHIEIYDDWRE